MLYLAKRPPGMAVPVRQISADVQVPPTYLVKVCQRLAAAGLMRTTRGTQGGVALARPAPTIVLLDVVTALDGPGLFEMCVLGLPGCGHATPCPMHDLWRVERQRLHDLFQQTSLADLVLNDTRLADLEILNL